MITDLFSGDEAFDSLYTLRTRQLSAIHWTPLEIVRKAAHFLCAGGGKQILDIGSGVGKFCVIAAHFHPDCIFHGVEQRKSLVDEAIIAQKATNTTNANFIHGNFNTVHPDQYDHFYFYNSFMENFEYAKPIDNLLPSSPEIYQEYLQQLTQLLEERRPGTRLATYHTDEQHIPASYTRTDYQATAQLSFWVKNF